MTIAWLEPGSAFPPSWQAWTDQQGANGLLAASATLSPIRLMQAYRLGIFPWGSENSPVLWWTPDPRMVLRPAHFRWHKSLRQALRRFRDEGLVLQMDPDPVTVIRECAAPRPGADGTWITQDILRAYGALTRSGHVRAITLWREGRRIGGLYFVSMGQMVYGESMFSREPNASRACLAALVSLVITLGGDLIDCQQQTDHLALHGASPISRAEFESEVLRRVEAPALAWPDGPIDWALLESTWQTSKTSR